MKIYFIHSIILAIFLFIATNSFGQYCSGTTIITASSGSLSDGSGIYNYLDNTNCSWLIKPTNAATITLTFTSFYTEQNFDYVKIYDGPTTSSSLLGSFSGSTIPSSINSTGGEMLIIFTSDLSNTYDGWNANFTSTLLPPCTNPPIAGNAVSNANPVCPNETFQLSLNSNTIGSGQTYKWQSSLDSMIWSDMVGTNTENYITSQTTDSAFYRCVVTCSGSLDTSTVIIINTKYSLDCYCQTNLHGNNCSQSDNIDSVSVSGTTLQNFSTGCTSNYDIAYSIFPASGNTTAILYRDSTYLINVTSTSNSIISVWIDYNQNYEFEVSEWEQVTTTSIPNVTASVSITIPTSAILGQTLMRVRTRLSGSPNTATDACSEFFSGETEDYIITINGSLCFSPPIAGNAVSNINPVCSNDTFILSLSNNTQGLSQLYQWQSSVDSLTWSDLGISVNENYIINQTADSLFYRCLVTCSGSTDTSKIIRVNKKSIANCYCIPSYTNSCISTNDYINTFTFNTLTALDAGCNGNINNYILYNSPTTSVVRKDTINISMQSGPNYAEYFGVWIDYNQDGDFNETGEFVYNSPGSSTSLLSGTIIIPASASLGTTRLRVRCSYTPSITASDYCSNLSFGETEDFTITIAPSCISEASSNADDDIGNVNFAGINNGLATPSINNTNAFNTYTDFTSSVSPATVYQGLTYPISISQINSSTFYPCIVNVFIDYNNDSIFDPVLERAFTQSTNAQSGGNTVSGNIAIPYISNTGLVKMRVILTEIYGNYGTVNDPPCGEYPFGETEDYSVRILPGTTCITPPIGGHAMSNDTIVCSDSNFTLFLDSSATGGVGQLYQWQKKTNNNLWQNIPSAQNGILITTQNEVSAYYRCILTCNNTSDTSTSVHIKINAADCYCTPIIAYGCSSVYIDEFEVHTLSNIHSFCSNTSGYINYPPTGAYTTSMFTGSSYLFRIKTGSTFGGGAAIYIDFNSNGSFSDTGEMVYTSTYSSLSFSGFINIPNNPDFIGQKKMRVILNNNETFTSTGSCSDFNFGEAEDYTITIKTGSSCSTPLTQRLAVASVDSVCQSELFYLSLPVADSTGINQTYQWQYSINNTNWINLTNNNSFRIKLSQQTARYYRCITGCSSFKDTSSVVYVSMKTLFNCYCSSYALHTEDDDIGNVTFANINNGDAIPAINNPNSNNTYSDFTNLPPANLEIGSSYQISVSQINLNSFFKCSVNVYIDYNHNGTFDLPSENVFSAQTTTAGMPVTGSVTIYSSDILNGITLMRVVLIEGTSPIATPCGEYSWGETEDYLVNILPGAPCTSPPLAGNISSTVSQVCPEDPFVLFVENNGGSINQTYQWQRSNDSITWTKIINETFPSCNIYSQDSSTYYRCNVTCNQITSTTPAIHIKNKPSYLCNCNTNLHYNLCSATDNIKSVSILSTSLQNNNTGCTGYNGLAYSVFPDTNFTTTALQKGMLYELRVTTAGNSIISAWIDYNQNAVFDSIEFIPVSINAMPGAPVSKQFTIPLNAKTGKTGLRIRCRSYNENYTEDEAELSCYTFSSGETEDYIIQIEGALNIIDNDISAQLEILPNPNNGNFSVYFSDPDIKNFKINLSSISGAVLLYEKYDINTGKFYKEYSITETAKGLYILRIITDKYVLTRKIIFY